MSVGVFKAVSRRGALGLAVVVLVAGLAACGPAGLTATALGLGRVTGCAIVAEGKVKCWGDNGFGQVGNGTLVDARTPVDVSGLTGATALAVGDRHVCALVAAGAVKCWGANEVNQLGNGTSAQSTIPVSVTGITGATAIAAGAAHTCAILANATAKCWGSNVSGQLGNGSSAQPTTPVVVSTLAGATSITGGWSHTCAVVTGGAVNCWGGNDSGQLGTGTTTGSNKPKVVVGVSGATSVSAGDFHSCALLAGGTAKCWGRNTYGALGDGTTTSSSSAKSVNGISGASLLSAGGFQTCAVISGAASCWGDGYYGQLGGGTTYVPSLTPVTVTGLTGVTALSTEGSTACAIAGGFVSCWGNNTAGQLGQPATNVRAVSYNLANGCTATACHGGTGEADIKAAITAGGAKADVYAVQQLCSNNAQSLTATLGTDYRRISVTDVASPGAACPGSGSTIGNSLFVNTGGSSVWTPASLTFATTDSPATRVAGCVHTQVRSVPTFACTTHLAEGADPAKATAEAAELLTFVARNAKGFETVIVAGDFNLAPSAGGTGWDKAWRDAGFIDTNAAHTATDAAGQQTDYVWISQASSASTAITLGQTSDHRAVDATLTPFLFASPYPVLVSP